MASTDDLGSVLDGLKPGTSVPVDLVSPDGSTRTIDVTLGTRPLPATLP